MAESPEVLFYELMWRIEGQGRRLPLPWWVQQHFRAWTDAYDGGLFSSKEAAFASNALYRYWSMVGVKDRRQECLVGQSGELEPVYDEYALGFFLFDLATRRAYFPQYPDFARSPATLSQQWEARYLPVLKTEWATPLGFKVEQKAIATTVDPGQKDLVLARFRVRPLSAEQPNVWFCLSITPAGPTGFRRQDRTGQAIGDRRITSLRYQPANCQVEVNRVWGPTFDAPPQRFGVYGNGGDPDPDFYLSVNPYEELLSRGVLNGRNMATDFAGGYCQAVFAWDLSLSTEADVFALDVRLPVGDYRGEDDLRILRAASADNLEQGNRDFWTAKLDGSGLQASLPASVSHLFELFRICRATLLILSDNGEIHPGPTIYDSFWIRDSSVEGIACALAGDLNLPERQFGEHYTRRDVFHQEHGTISGTEVSIHGFFGHKHEQQDREWDSNGQALWAFGRFDRIGGAAFNFGAGVFSPYVVEGSSWIRRNRSPFGLLHSGWSAEHLGEKDKPHYWDDFWALAGLWEAAQLATRLNAPQAREIWDTYDELRVATADSIRWVLDRQREQGHWETFIPTGPADVGRLDSTIVGAVAYFHPCRLYDGAKLGSDIDQAARMTLETIWDHFMDGGGFRHDAAWRCYGPYLTLQLAHAFLLTGDVERMDRCLAWAVGDAAYAKVRAFPGAASAWQVALGAWNEQHCYPVAKDFGVPVTDWWYMGDIPHGWAAAELMLLLRGILFFEADEDRNPHIYIAPGVPPHWLVRGEMISVRDAPTIFGAPFGYDLRHDPAARTVTIDVRQTPPGDVHYVYPCRLGACVTSVRADGQLLLSESRNVLLPTGMSRAVIEYA